MCVLAAQQDNKATEANGYSMSEETKERQRRRCDVMSGSIRPSEHLSRRTKTKSNLSKSFSDTCASCSGPTFEQTSTIFPRNYRWERCPDPFLVG